MLSRKDSIQIGFMFRPHVPGNTKDFLNYGNALIYDNINQISCEIENGQGSSGYHIGKNNS